jgi:hypothetical protein
MGIGFNACAGDVLIVPKVGGVSKVTKVSKSASSDFFEFQFLMQVHAQVPGHGKSRPSIRCRQRPVVLVKNFVSGRFLDGVRVQSVYGRFG